MESLAREFQLYGSVQGSAVGPIQMKCIHDLDEAERLAAETIQLKPIVAAAPAAGPAAGTAAAAAAAAGSIMARSVGGSTVPSVCKSVSFLTD